MQSKAKTVKDYLAELPPDRREAISAVRAVILKNLGKGYEEGMSYGMIGYFVPHSIYPAGYHCDPKQPLPFAGLASQKNYMSVYLMPLYSGFEGGALSEDARRFQEAWAKTGKKLDMGKCCIRFKRVEDLALDVIGEAVRRVPMKSYIEFYEKALLSNNKAAAERAAARKKAFASSAPPTAAKDKTPKKKAAGKTSSKRIAKRPAKASSAKRVGTRSAAR